MMLGQPPQQVWNQQQTMIRMPLMQPAGMPTPANTTPNPDRSSAAAAEHTNLMERTREDELLGENATMSNVLYCNVNHPDLKQQFPGKDRRVCPRACIAHNLFISVFRYVPPCE